MKEQVETYLNLVFRIGLILVVLSTLFLFTNLTTEFYDTPKLVILIIFTAVMLLVWTVKFTLVGKVTFIRTPLDIPLLLLLVVGIISTALSPAPYVSLLGNQLRVSTSLIFLITLVLFFFILTNNLKSVRMIKAILNLSLGAAALLSAVSLLTFWGVTLLPKPWTHGLNFTPTGSNFSTTAVLALLLPISILGIFSTRNLVTKVIYAILLILFGTTIALTGVWATWIAALSAVAVSLAIHWRSLSHPNFWKDVNVILIVVSTVVVALIAALSFIPPVGGAKNPFYTQARNFPRELQLPLIFSWKISVSAFRDSPFWGTGPSTYLFDFTNYKPIEFNSEKSWNLRFDTSFNEYLQVLATLGGVGLLALVSLTALFITSAWPHLLGRPAHGLGVSGGELKPALAISGLIFLVILAFHASSLVVWVMGFVILALFFSAAYTSDGYLKKEAFPTGGSVGQVLNRIAFSSEETFKIEAVPSVLLTIAIALTLSVAFFGAKFVLADYHHRLALNAISQNNGVLAYNELVAAEKLNPQSDLYRTDIAQVNFALANAIAQAKAPTEASPTGSLTDQDKQNIQVLLQQSINEGRTAVALSPRSAVNWEILASLYRQIAGVAQNALVFALDAYGRAIFQDPLNPLLRLNVGGTYYAIKNYDLAIRFFTDSINLKPDFANGYYNLSVALRDKGDLNSALLAAQKVVELVDKNSPDYKVATDYLNDLKNKVSPPTPEQPPAAQTTGALQQKELPKVLDVGTPPEKIATPEAVKKPSPTPRPTP